MKSDSNHYLLLELVPNNKEWFTKELRSFLLENEAVDAICKLDAVEAVYTSGFAFFSSNAPCFQRNRGITAIYKLNAIEAVCSDALVPLHIQLPSVFGDEYVEPSILGNKGSLICIVIESSKKKNRTNLRTK